MPSTRFSHASRGTESCSCRVEDYRPSSGCQVRHGVCVNTAWTRDRELHIVGTSDSGDSRPSSLYVSRMGKLLMWQIHGLSLALLWEIEWAEGGECEFVWRTGYGEGRSGRERALRPEKELYGSRPGLRTARESDGSGALPVSAIYRGARVAQPDDG